MSRDNEETQTCIDRDKKDLKNVRKYGQERDEVDCSSAWWAAITAALGGLGEHSLMSQGDDGSFFLSQCRQR